MTPELQELFPDSEAGPLEPLTRATEYRIAFCQGAVVKRWKLVPGATSDHDAIEKCIRRTRKGTVKRLQRRNKTLQVVISRPKDPCYANGKPALVQGYSVQFS